jgi:Carbohydrate binding domain
MKITNWTHSVAGAIAAERGQTKAWKRWLTSVIVGGGIALGSSGANAATIHPIDDASFDDLDLSGSGNYAYISSLGSYPWIPTSNSWLYNSTYAAGSAQQSTPLSLPNAVHLADSNVFQVIGDKFESGRIYTLSAWVRYDADSFVGADFGLRLFDGTGGTFANVLASQDYLFGVDIFDDDTWREMSLTFTADANSDGKPIGIYLGPEAAANKISVDNVSLTSVPEPGAAALMGAGSVLIWQLVRRRRPEDDLA